MNSLTTALICFLMAMTLTVSGAAALEPTFETGEPVPWPSVQGDESGNPYVVIPTDLSAGKSQREKFPDVPAWIVSDDFDGDGKSEAGILFNEALSVSSP